MEEIFRAIIENKRVGPKLLMLSTTDYCNLRCKTCWRLRKDATFNQPSFSFLNKIIREAKEIGVKTVDISGGGEPFVRKNILKIMELIKKMGMRGVITTNATLIKESDVKKIVKMGWDEMNISLDGSKSEINDFIRGRDTFKCVLKKIEMLNKNIESKPLLRLCFTMTKVNIEDIPNYLILADQLNIKNINFSTLFEWESNKLLWLSRDEGKKIMKIVKSGLKLSKKLGIKTNLSAIQEFGVFEHRPPKFCFAPWYMLFINASREAIMCCTLASLYQNRLGKVRSLAKIWNSEKMEGIRRRMKTRKFFNECKKCLPEFTQMFDNLYKEMRRWKLKK